MNTRLYILIALLLCALGAWWMSQRQTEEPANSFESVLEVKEPDVQATDVSFSQLRPDGSLHYQLNAAAIRQFNEPPLTRLTTPHLHLLNPTQPPWDIRSKSGHIRKLKVADGTEEDMVFLRGNVIMSQHHEINGLLTIYSETVYIYPVRQYAETDQDVMIDTSVGRTEAAGFSAAMQQGVLSLSSNAEQRVHTIILPEQFKDHVRQD